MKFHIEKTSICLSLVFFVFLTTYVVLNSHDLGILNLKLDSFVFGQSQNLSLSTLINDGSPYYGNLSAPIVVVDFSDFQCHLCKRYVDNTEPQINSTYIQKGKVVYVFKHLPNRGIESKPISLASQCINDQGKFWDFHKLLYEKQGPIDSGWANSDNIKKFVSQLNGINADEFNSCFNDKKYDSFIDNDIALANSLGFHATPSFLIMNSEGSIIKKIEGPKPFPIFSSVIETLEKDMANN